MHYVDFDKLADGNLRITWAEGVEPSEKAELRDMALKYGYVAAESAAIEYQIGNGWEWLKPEDLGWLVSDTAPIYSDSVLRNGKDEIVSVKRVYFQTDYAIRSWLDVLLDKGEAILTGVE